VEFEHVVIIHFVHVIAAEDKDALRTFSLKNVNVLINTIRRSSIPPIHESLLGRNAFDKFAELMIEYVPPETNVSVK